MIYENLRDVREEYEPPEGIIGMRRGAWVVDSIAGTHPSKGVLFNCVLDNGLVFHSTANKILSGFYDRCDGSRKPRKKTKANTDDPTNSSWKHMMGRCYNERETGYHRYGGRGIKVCDRWHKFENFLEDMGPKPEDMSLDRIDCDGDYCKENCRWATMRTQQNNRRNNVKGMFRGEMLTAPQISRRTGLSASSLYLNIKKGVSMDEYVEMKTSDIQMQIPMA